MKKLSIIAQWLVVAAVAAFVGYVVWRPTPQPDYTPGTWRHWNGVTVLSYAGIARKDSPGYPSAKRLEAQLGALRDAGYRTVRPEDVVAYLEERAPLPEKALLLIFEGGRKESFIRATPVLQRTGFSAVIAVPTTVMDQWGGFYLKRRDIRRVSRLPQWQVGSMGHRAIEPLADSTAPTESERFLAQRIRANGKTESSDDFRDRILGDYAESAKLLERAAGRPPLLYLYPFAEAGQGPDADPLAETVNRDAVTRHFGLAFIGGSNAFNGPGSDPWTLSRLRVPGDWAPERLLAELTSSQPRSRAQTTVGNAQDWVFERQGELRGDELHLAAGANAWLRGTDGWTDSDLHAELAHGADGAAALYARYTGSRSWLRVVSDSDGIRVQERLGGRLHTLFRSQSPSGEHVARRIRLRLRNNRAWVWLNDESVAANLPVSPETRHGRVGLGSERGTLRATAISAQPLPSRWLLANSIRLVPEESRDQVQAVLPTWFRASDSETIVPQTALQDLMLTAVAGIHTYPVLAGGATLAPEAARSWAGAIDEAITRADVKMLVSTLAVEGPAQDLADELRDRHYRVVHVLTPDQTLERGRSIAQATPDEVIVVNARGAEADAALAWMSRVVPPRRMAVREADEAALAQDTATVRLLDSTADR